MSLFSALVNVFNDETVSQETRRIRLSHCSTCVKNRGNICIKCGCYLPLKTLSPDERCPLEYPKWVEEKK